VLRQRLNEESTVQASYGDEGVRDYVETAQQRHPYVGVQACNHTLGLLASNPLIFRRIRFVRHAFFAFPHVSSPRSFIHSLFFLIHMNKI